MSQHDYNIANGGGAAVRADLNNALLAILSQNSGATAPTTTKPFMFWYDTTTGVLKMRNAADTAWVAAIDGIGNGNPVGIKNRVINGAMMIDQRNAGASISGTSGNFAVDRFEYSASQSGKVTLQQNSGSVTPPAGFKNYLGVVSSSAYSVLSSDIFKIRQHIEGFNVADLNWGTANAAPVTLSFWVRSSLTGTFGGALLNQGETRSYPFSYTINAANTWEQKTVTIAGDQSGTWATDNGIGIRLTFGLGVGSTYNGTAGSWSGTRYESVTGATSVVGTSGATFYITGVQLEKGSIATAFDWRPYGQELALCQRYCPAWTAETTAERGNLMGQAYSTTNSLVPITFPVTARVAPTGISTTGAFTLYNASLGGLSASLTFNNASIGGASIQATVASGLVAGNATLFQANGAANPSRIIFTGCEL